jgi:hypothetical protein
MSKIKTIIESQTEKYQFIEIKSFEPKQKALTTVSLAIIEPDANMMGYGIEAAHCQEGQEKNIMDIEILKI